MLNLRFRKVAGRMGDYNKDVGCSQEDERAYRC